MTLFEKRGPRARSLEQCAVVGETRGESVHRRGGAYVPQGEHRPIALEERELPIKKLAAQLLYGRLCRSPRLYSSRKEAGGGRGRIDRGISSGLTGQRGSAQKAKIVAD